MATKPRVAQLMPFRHTRQRTTIRLRQSHISRDVIKITQGTGLRQSLYVMALKAAGKPRNMYSTRYILLAIIDIDIFPP